MLRVTFGYGLFAFKGKHKGSGMGHFYPPDDLTLYGVDNFAKRGGMALHRYGQHERFRSTQEEMNKLCEWKDR
jgi:hypothetical protein